MDLIQIKGGNFLEGEINISGSKNASLPMVIASLLTKDKVIIRIYFFQKKMILKITVSLN